MVTLETWRTRMAEDMKLRDFRPRTQEGYTLAVRQFLDRVQREPEMMTDEDVRAYFLYLREAKKLAPSSINIAVHALRFFFIHTLQRDWPLFDLLRVNKPRMLPVVLSTGEVRTLLGAVRIPCDAELLAGGLQTSILRDPRTRLRSAPQTNAYPREQTSRKERPPPNRTCSSSSPSTTTAPLRLALRVKNQVGCSHGLSPVCSTSPLAPACTPLAPLTCAQTPRKRYFVRPSLVASLNRD